MTQKDNLIHRKVLDSRISALIQNGIQERKRSFFVLVGDDRAKDVIVSLQHIISRHNPKNNKNVLWAYKTKLLGFTSHRKKREQKIKKEVRRGLREANAEDPFELFVASQNITYVFYKAPEKILGNTYGTLILQDFEAITPNILAQTIETVEGGGLVIMLLKGMNSLKQLYTMSMDMHARYRTEAYQDIVPRFNERFILSLGSCETCLVIDDEFNVLPVSGGKSVVALPPADLDQPKSESQRELETLKESLRETQPTGSLVTLARTIDQAKALVTFVDAIVEKTLRSTVTLTAARGRGKSAALGLAVAAAVAHGYSNIYITSPTPENLKTLFEFIFKGFDALGYADVAHYSIIRSTAPEFGKAIVRVNIHREHRQTIQYVRPGDSHVLGQAELVVIDEAAAIPLPLVRKLLGPYLVFMASTVSGYEGTGRSLSLKLVKQLREQSQSGHSNDSTEVISRSAERAGSQPTTPGNRKLREITLAEPIRYGRGDGVEKWLNTLLCLEATLPRSKASPQFPDPSQCELLYINRDSLFSFHPVSEKFLHSVWALFVSSHYKNSPNDLSLMSDSPAHELYVLVSPISKEGNQLPEPICVIQVALEGKISRQSVISSLARGQRAAGDLIPWLVSQQFQDDEFAGLSGGRIVRIATAPENASMGYGTQALRLLIDHYEGKFTSLSEDADGYMEETIKRVSGSELKNASLMDDNVKVREWNSLPPLFTKLSDRRPPALDYIGVSYGLTAPLHRFWKRAGFSPVYIRQTSNDITGEHTCVMLRRLVSSSVEESSLAAFAADFHRRFLSLLSYEFRDFSSMLAIEILRAARVGAKKDGAEATAMTKAELDRYLTPYDIKRLEAYARNTLDYRVILDLLPVLAQLFFSSRLEGVVSLNHTQQAILLAVGLQHKDVGVVGSELTMESSQLLGMFIKIVKKMTTHFETLVHDAISSKMPQAASLGVSHENASGAHDDELVDTRLVPLEMSLEDELEEGADEVLKSIRQKQRELIDSLPLDQYEVEGDNPDWDEAEKQVMRSSKKGGSTVVSVKSSKVKRKTGPTAAEIYEEAMGDTSKKKHKKPKH